MTVAGKHRPNPPEGTAASEYVCRCVDCGDWLTRCEVYGELPDGSYGRVRTYWQHVGGRSAERRLGILS